MLSLPANVRIDIYRGFTAGDPYPAEPASPVYRRIPGYLKHNLRRGRLGKDDTKIKWTHVLLLDPKVDIRSAYNGWTGPAEPTQDADTVLIHDYPLAGR